MPHISSSISGIKWRITSPELSKTACIIQNFGIRLLKRARLLKIFLVFEHPEIRFYWHPWVTIRKPARRLKHQRDLKLVFSHGPSGAIKAHPLREFGSSISRIEGLQVQTAECATLRQWKELTYMVFQSVCQIFDTTNVFSASNQ